MPLTTGRRCWRTNVLHTCWPVHADSDALAVLSLPCRQKGDDKGAQDPAPGDAADTAAQATPAGAEATSRDQEARGRRRVPEAAGSAAEGGEGTQAGATTDGVAQQVVGHAHRLSVVGRQEVSRGCDVLTHSRPALWDCYIGSALCIVVGLLHWDLGLLSVWWFDYHIGPCYTRGAGLLAELCASVAIQYWCVGCVLNKAVC